MSAAATSCKWCEEGNPRVRSSVSEAFVHTDTPVGRAVCTLGPETAESTVEQSAGEGRETREAKVMTFEFEGAKYRIGFRHERSREWAAHQQHNVALRRDQVGEKILGPVYLWCADCHVRLSHLPKGERLRNTACVILREDPTGWRPIGHASGSVNVKAGDMFNKRAGAVAALEAVLGSHQLRNKRRSLPAEEALLLPIPATSLPEYYTHNAAFRDLAWKAYLERRNKPEAVNHAG